MTDFYMNVGNKRGTQVFYGKRSESKIEPSIKKRSPHVPRASFISYLLWFLIHSALPCDGWVSLMFHIKSFPPANPLKNFYQTQIQEESTPSALVYANFSLNKVDLWLLDIYQLITVSGSFFLNARQEQRQKKRLDKKGEKVWTNI